MPSDVALGDRPPEPDDQLSVHVLRQTDTVVLAVAGELDMLTAAQVEAAVVDALVDPPRVLIVDLTGVTFLASAGLTVLVEASRHASERTRFGVVAADRITRRPLEITGLYEAFAVYASRADALAGADPSTVESQ
jgi:anti-sigma B factor antagonist